jgi:hypothetical protein
MTEIHAKPIVDGKFWIVEQDENKVGVLKLTEQKKFVFSSKDTITVFDNKTFFSQDLYKKSVSGNHNFCIFKHK